MNYILKEKQMKEETNTYIQNGKRHIIWHYYKIIMYKMPLSENKYIVALSEENGDLKNQLGFKTRLEADYNFQLRSSEFPSKFTAKYPTFEIYKQLKTKKVSK